MADITIPIKIDYRPGLVRGGGAWSGGRWVSQHALRQTPLPSCGQTHACKNITLAQLRCGREQELLTESHQYPIYMY